MSTSHYAKIKPSYLFELEDSPCKKCLVQSTCTKQFTYKRTACNDYIRFVLNIIKEEKAGETKK